jgi:hemerythrin
MSLIEWREEFSVGNAAVDREHRELIDAINALHADLAQGAIRVRVVERLGDIYAEIAAHFALEEKMMRDASYDGYGPHKVDHESLLDQLADIIDAFELKGTYDEEALSSALDAWFSEHFRTHDARLHGKL